MAYNVPLLPLLIPSLKVKRELDLYRCLYQLLDRPGQLPKQFFLFPYQIYLTIVLRLAFSRIPHLNFASGSGHGPVASFCEHDDELYSYIKSGEFLY